MMMKLFWMFSLMKFKFKFQKPDLFTDKIDFNLKDV